jgi:hypothetical protein
VGDDIGNIGSDVRSVLTCSFSTHTGTNSTLSSPTVTNGVKDNVVSPTISPWMGVSNGAGVLEGGQEGTVNAGEARARPVVDGKSASGRAAGIGAVTTVTPAGTPFVTSVDRQMSARATGGGVVTVTIGEWKGDGDCGGGDGNGNGDCGDSGCVTVAVSVAVAE